MTRRHLVDDEFNGPLPSDRRKPTQRMMCPQCGVGGRITERNAFGGMDKLRMTLSCGHVVAKQL